jgi:peptidoglycan/LPS O-acetylase OafA/YrhL
MRRPSFSDGHAVAASHYHGVMGTVGTPRRVAEIDGLRAIAMSMVIAQHCWIMPFGWIGVWIFFVISGYVISLTLFAEKDIAALPGTLYRLFVIRRFFRIVPIYVLYIAVNAALIVAIGRSSALLDLPFLLSFTYNWQMIYDLVPVSHGWSAFGHLWTLSIEEQFYLFYPFLVLWLSRRHFLATILVLIAAGPFIRWGISVLSAAASDDAGWIAFSIYASSICQFDAFLVGAALAYFRRTIEATPRIARWIWTVTAVFSATYVAGYVTVNAVELGAIGPDILRRVYSGVLYGQGREVFGYTSVTLIAASIMSAIIVRHPLSRVLRWKPLVEIGRISYGGYLYHALVLLLIGYFFLTVSSRDLPIWNRLLLFAAAWSVTVALAFLSFRFFEKRFLAWSDAISRRILLAAPPLRSATPAAPAAARA